MFFYIGKIKDKTFPNHVNWGNYYISYDNGWTLHENYLYKGVNSFGLITEKDKNTEGTFCIFEYKDNNILIHTGKKQNFPLYINLSDCSVNNLFKDSEEFTGNVVITPTEIICNQTPDISYTELHLSDEEIINQIDYTLEKTILDFRHNEPFKLYITGGVDTLIIASYILKHQIPYELVEGEHADMDYFLCQHRNSLMSKFWAYSTVQHWKKPSILLTGAHGDETMLRDPVQAFLLLKHHGENLVDVCNSNNLLYHSQHCLKDSCIELYDKYKDVEFTFEGDLKTFLLNLTRCDYQHWHLGNTLFFSPFTNLNILNLFLNLSYNTARAQMLDASVSKQLIERNRPGLLSLLSPLKNVNYYQKLGDLYDGKVSLEDL
jgi:hypothetical protein